MLSISASRSLATPLLLSLKAFDRSAMVCCICANSSSGVPDGIVVVGATDVVVGAVSMMVVAHDVSDTRDTVMTARVVLAVMVICYARTRIRLLANASRSTS